MKAIITISGIQGVVDAGDDAVEMSTDGVYSRTDEGFVLSYRESELTGLQGTVTTVYIDPDKITVERTGTLNATMVFKENEKTRFLYDTQFGGATLEIDTRKITAAFNDFGGELCIDYVVNVEHTIVSKNKLCVAVKPRG